MSDEDQIAEDRIAGEELSFSVAMEELERILKGIEDEEVDIDLLGRELKRAAELLELCRTKIRRAETEVSQIVQGLDETRGATGSEAIEPGEEPEEVESGKDELPF